MQTVYMVLVYLSLVVSIAHMFALSLGGRKRSVIHIFLASVVVLSECGYARLITVKEVETAFLANKITYIGGCLLPILIVRIGAKFCGLALKKWHYRALEAIAVLDLAMAWTAGYTDWFYRDVNLVFHNGITFMEKTYGPLHSFHYIYLGCYMIFAVAFIVRAIRNRSQFSVRAVLLYACIWLSVIVVYFGERALHLQYPILPIVMAVALSIFVHQFRMVNLFDMDENIATIYDRQMENGYVAFDTKFRFTGCNELAAKMFPELSDFRIDSKIDGIAGSHFYSKIYKPFVVDGYSTVSVITNGEFRVRVQLRDVRPIGRGKSIGKLFELRDISEEEKYNEMLRNYQAHLETEVNEKTDELTEMRQKVIMGMAAMIESRDLSTGGHIRRTSDVIGIFAREILESGFPADSEFLHRVVIAAPMHDLGKIAVDDAVLRKQGKFTDEEYAVMKTHAPKGAEIVKNVLKNIDDKMLVTIATNVAHYHHEKWNGTGYPDGLKGDAIPLEARIMALADVFDALVSKRCYKNAYSYDEAFRIIDESIGSHFDPKLGKLFMNIRPALEELYDSYTAEDEKTEEEVKAS